MEKRLSTRHLWDELGSIALALVLALAIWVLAIYEENPPKTELFPQGIPIEIVEKDERLVILGDIVEEMQITVRASKSSWESLTPSSFRAFINLEGLKAGLHEVEVQVECPDRSVEILKKEPEKVAIRLEELKTKELTVRVDISGAPAQGYIDKNPTVTPSKVKVVGPGSIVDRVATVVAEVHLWEAKDTIEKMAVLSPLDEKGESLGGVDLDPTQVRVRVPIEQRLGYKDVAVRVLWEGQVASGYRISNISVKPSIVTVTGSPSAIEEIPGYLQTMLVDIEGATADIVERLLLTLPDGITTLGEQGVLVKINVTAIESSLTIRRELIIQGLDQSLEASLSPDAVDIILSGPVSKLQELELEQVQVVLDLFGLGKGTHKLIPTVIVPRELKVESIMPETIEVKIEPLPTPTPTPSSE